MHYGFGAMRTQVMLLDHDPQVVALACSPVELAWLGEDGIVAVHAPRLMARLRDGSDLLVDCAGSEGVPARLVDHAAAMAAAARTVGWDYRITRPPDPVLAAHVRWLSGYRHPRHGGSTAMARVAGLADAGARSEHLADPESDLERAPPTAHGDPRPTSSKWSTQLVSEGRIVS
ncbi:hypothetical protein KCMC57_up00050 [Kitasatospora sp. CMC57]|uniref:Uncharacterized protein n=1 Tax=Kitasatospora sp. CMC57 TaxID=3231513 RepID=A0AB33K5V2_9ACTN